MDQTKQNMPSLEILLDYLCGILNYDAKRRLEDQIQNSEELSAIVSGLEVYFNQIGQDRAKMEAYIKESGLLPEEKMNTGNQPSEKSTNTFSLFRIAAVITLLIVSAVTYYLLVDQNSVSELALAQLSQPYSAPEVVRGDQEQVTELWSIAGSYYSQKNYQDAIQTITEIDKLDGDDPRSSFYLGLCYLYQQERNSHQAEIELKKVKDVRHFLGIRATWYLALTYIVSDRPEEAKPLLKKVIEMDDYKSKQARELISEL